MKKPLYLLFLVILLGGCATLSTATSTNRENLLKLSIGMSKVDAVNIMGTKTMVANNLLFNQGQRPVLKINNPYRSEILQGKDRTFEVLYYVTDDKTGSGVITDDDLTPLVFDDGKLIGWGRSFLQDNAQKHEIRIR